jgi:hypothetical protein
MKKSKENSLSADQIGYFGKPSFTREDLIQSNLIKSRMRAFGIRVYDSFANENSGSNSSSGLYTEDELEALKYIYANKAVPEELAQRLIDRQLPKKRTETNDITISDEEIEEFLAKVDSKH